jgi:16S rRNA (guanine527-N7)-methyltransferase
VTQDAGSRFDDVASARGLTLSPELRTSLVHYAELLALHGQRANLVGTGDITRLADELVLDAMELVALLPAASGLRALDVGSGAGLPGIPLALARRDWNWTLVEPRSKRYQFLLHARRTLGLTNVEVRECRLEDLGDARWDLVVSKAVFEPREWVERGTALLTPSGHVGLYLNGTPAEALPELPAVAAHHGYRLLDGRERTVALVQGAG